jgi:hypothetical protein
VQMWELVAREQIRATLARYNWSGDAGRPGELAETFCADGVLEIRGMAPLRGRADITAFLGGITVTEPAGEPAGAVRRIVRHHVANIWFTDVAPDRAHVWSYFTVVTAIGLDHCGRYRDVLVPEAGGWLIAQRKVTTDWVAAGSTLARR